MGTAGSEADTDAASYADLNDDSETDLDTDLASEVEQMDRMSEVEGADPATAFDRTDVTLEAEQGDENRIQQDGQYRCIQN